MSQRCCHGVTQDSRPADVSILQQSFPHYRTFWMAVTKIKELKIHIWALTWLSERGEINHSHSHPGTSPAMLPTRILHLPR